MPDEKLLSDIDAYLTKGDAPGFDIRSRTASSLREEANKYKSGREHNPIDVAMSQVDQEKLGVLLHEIADHLCPKIK